MSRKHHLCMSTFLHIGLLPVLTISICFGAAPSLAQASEPAEFLVTDFGAIPDNGELDSEAIQAAIDACAEAGGGVVRFPSGRFLAGGLHLRDNVSLYLERDAILQGSDNYQDYGEGQWTDALISGIGVSNIRIEGEGLIDGVDCERPGGEEGFRGPHAIFLREASDIVIRDISIINAGNYAIICRESHNAEIVNVTIRGGHDGLHAQACSNFSIRDCDFRTGDDCLAGCDNVDFEIINCKINSSCNGFRLGCVNLLVEDCTFWGPGEHPHKVSVKRGEPRYNMLSAFTHFAPTDRDPQLPSDNWLIRNCTIDNVGFVYGYDFERGLWQTGQPAKRIRFENVKATNIARPLRVLGDEERQFDLTLDNVFIRMHEDHADQEVLNLTRFGVLRLKGVSLLNDGIQPVLRAQEGDLAQLESVSGYFFDREAFDFKDIVHCRVDGVPCGFSWTDPPRLEYVASWIGNTFSGTPGWVPHDIDDIYVGSDGTVYTNVSWEENRNNVVAIQNGEYIAGVSPFDFTGGGNVPRRVGKVITGNERYIYYSSAYAEGTPPDEAITRRDRPNINEGHLSVNLGIKITGLAATDKEVYAACVDGRIRVFDLDLQPLREFEVAGAPGKMCVDAEGALWYIDGGVIRRTSAESFQLPQVIELPDDVIATALAVMPDGRLLVADAGWSEQIRIYKNITEAPELDRAFGETGGIYAGETPGRHGPMRFLGPIGVGADSQSNIYVAHSLHSDDYIGSAMIQSHTEDGRLNWQVMAQEWIDCLVIDPETEVDVYSKKSRYSIDFSNPPGQEWTLQATTIHRHLFPEDPRLQRGHKGGTLVRILDGQRLLFVNDMFGRYYIFRFDPENYGEIAIPCGRVSSSEIWYDANGDGYETPDEVIEHDAGESRGWWVDVEGTVWQATRHGGIYKYPLMGIDDNGVPVYSIENREHFDNPSRIDDLRRIYYDPKEDALYLGGGSYRAPVQHWKPMGPNLIRYDNWHSEPTQRWHWTLPFQLANFQHESYEPHGFDIAGDYIFVVWVGVVPDYDIRRGTVGVFRKDASTAEEAFLGFLESPLEFGVQHVGIMDICHAINAYKHANGEYIVFIEDDARSKNVMFRWRPEDEN